uniref:Golgin subfamily A conserved domain-containing protein n=1 Tax=Pongo abelii TaxID=9601 RepID=H2NPG2_PONAB
MLSLLNRRQEERLHEQEETPREQEKLPGQETLLEQVEKLLEQERWQEEEERLLERERLLDQWRNCWNRRGCGSRRLCGSWRGCWSWGGKPSTSSGRSHTAALRSWCINNENKSTLQLEQQVKELKKLGAPGSYQPGETAAKAQLSLVALPGEGTGDHSEKEHRCSAMPNIPGDLESQEAMVAFFNSAGASALEEQRVCCQRLAHPVASSQKKPEAAAPAPETGGESVCGETHRALQGAMEKLQVSRTRWT